MSTSFEEDIDIEGGIATSEGTISGLLTIYGKVKGGKMQVFAGYGFDTPQFPVGEVSCPPGKEDAVWEAVRADLTAEAIRDKDGNVIPRRLSSKGG